MKQFTFVVMPGEHEYSIVGQDEAHAYKLLWQSLTPDQQDAVSYMECVDECPAVQITESTNRQKS